MPAVQQPAVPASPQPASQSGAQSAGSPILVLFAAVLALEILLHLPLLRLPYIWDETGYYVPAASDLLLTGSVIPHSTPSNAHPPLVMGWVALWWKILGFAPLVTRAAILVFAAFTLVGVFRLALRVANRQVAVASVICTGLYSVFFTQSSLAHLDMAAAGFTVWGLYSYLASRRAAAVLWFSLAGLAKETAIIAPIALFGWEAFAWLLKKYGHHRWTTQPIGPSLSLYLLVPVVPLAAWFAYHYAQAGYLFGNAEYFRYNVTSTLHPLRIVLALATRLWQLFGYMGMWALTVATLLAMCLPPQRQADKERPPISVSVQITFYVLIATYLLAMSVLGGALLARYLLPVYPLWIVVCVSTLWRRVRYWRAVTALVTAAFLVALFVNPPYGFAFEDNLAYRDYIRLHTEAETFIEARYPMARVLTAWPASDELSHPYLGYVSRPMRVVRIDDFSIEQVSAAANLRNEYDFALVFSTRYLPPHSLLARFPRWEGLQKRYFGFHRDLEPAIAAQVLRGELIYSAASHGQWIGVIRISHTTDADANQDGFLTALASHPPGNRQSSAIENLN